MSTVGYIGAGLCLVGVLSSLFSISHIVSDINSLRSEDEGRVDEFKVLADDTWQRLLILQPPNEKTENLPLQSFRLLSSVQQERDNNFQGCPAGPPGPPGLPGKRGDEGTPGDLGRTGASGISLAAVYHIPGGCLSCPAEPAGPARPQEPVGNQGIPGVVEPRGPSGDDGQPGPQGAQGDKETPRDQTVCQEPPTSLELRDSQESQDGWDNQESTKNQDKTKRRDQREHQDPTEKWLKWPGGPLRWTPQTSSTTLATSKKNVFV